MVFLGGSVFPEPPPPPFFFFKFFKMELQFIEFPFSLSPLLSLSEFYSLIPSLPDKTALVLYRWLVNSTPALIIFCFFFCVSFIDPPPDPKKKERRRMRIEREIIRKFEIICRAYRARCDLYDEHLFKMYKSGARITNLPTGTYHQWEQMYGNCWYEKNPFSYPKGYPKGKP